MLCISMAVSNSSDLANRYTSLTQGKKTAPQRTPLFCRSLAPWAHAGRSPVGCRAPRLLRPPGGGSCWLPWFLWPPLSSAVLLSLPETRHIISRAKICHGGSIAAVCCHFEGNATALHFHTAVLHFHTTVLHFHTTVLHFHMTV